jgi:hypothetical protein
VPRDHVISSDEATAKLAWTRTLKFSTPPKNGAFPAALELTLATFIALNPSQSATEAS